MADLLSDAIEWHNDTLQLYAGESVTLRRSGQTDTVQTATPGNAIQGSEDIDGLMFEERSHDWIVPAEDYNFGGAAVKPEKGDEIRQTVSGTTYVYRCLPVGSGANLYRETGTKKRMLRIHTKLIKTE